MLIVPLGITGNSERIGLAIRQRIPQAELYLDPNIKDVNHWKEELTQEELDKAKRLIGDIIARSLTHESVVLIIPTYSYPGGRWASSFTSGLMKFFDRYIAKKPLIVLNGNINFMNDFCAAERELLETWGDNVIAKVDMSGTPAQMDSIAQEIIERTQK